MGRKKRIDRENASSENVRGGGACTRRTHPAVHLRVTRGACGRLTNVTAEFRKRRRVDFPFRRTPRRGPSRPDGIKSVPTVCAHTRHTGRRTRRGGKKKGEHNSQLDDRSRATYVRQAPNVLWDGPKVAFHPFLVRRVRVDFDVSRPRPGSPGGRPDVIYIYIYIFTRTRVFSGSTPGADKIRRTRKRRFSPYAYATKPTRDVINKTFARARVRLLRGGRKS